MSPKYHVSVVSKDPSLGSSLKGPCKSAGLSMTVFGSVSDLIDALDPDKPVGCVISDLAGGVDLLRELTDQHWVVPVVLHAGSAGVTAAVQAIKLGAFDVCEKQDALIESAKRASSFSVRVQKLLEEKAVAAERIHSLTRREMQVLQLMVEGKPNREIAEELGISTKTLDIHRANLMDKMEARTSADMCRAYLLHRTTPSHLPLVVG